MWLSKDLEERLVKALERLAWLANENALQQEPEARLTEEKSEEIQEEAQKLVLELQQGPLPESTEPEAPKAKTDPRILRTVGKLRLVAPALRTQREGRGVYLNGELLIERRDTDGLGAERWTGVVLMRWPSPSAGDVPERAIFRVLAGDGWDDRELREYDK